MLIRTTDPFRELDRLSQQVLGTTNRPAVMPMDAWREGDRFVAEFDLPGIEAEYADGVLRLLVPVAERAKPRKIGVVGGRRPTAEGTAIEA